jgi:tetratricopeptide (TPR) repeat protein
MRARRIVSVLVVASALVTGACAAHAQLAPSPQPEALLAEGHTLYDAGRYKEAAAAFERAMQLGFGRPHEAAWKVAESYAKLGNRKQAMRWAEIAERLCSPIDRAGQEAVRALSTRRASRETT